MLYRFCLARQAHICQKQCSDYNQKVFYSLYCYCLHYHPHPKATTATRDTKR
jgi:hypothetical protein